MQHVAVRILHPPASPAAGPLELALVDARAANAERLAELFREAGATDVAIHAGEPDARSFGARLRALVDPLPAGAGLVIAGSGSIPLAMRADAEDLLAAAASGRSIAVTNNAFSADVAAIGRAAELPAIPDLPSDNALPRWLTRTAGYAVTTLSRPRLALDLDSPLDVLLAELALATPTSALRGIDTDAVRERAARLRALAGDARRQLVIAGRSSGTTLRWLEDGTASRTRMLVEERGLRAIGLDGAGQAPPRSVVGMVLDGRGPEAVGAVLADLGDGAIVDSRVLLAHRLGADEASWPGPEDRFASDLLLADQIADPWLRALTAGARDAAIPVLLGGHTLVGPGVRFLLGSRRA
jgi:hypothetical protein